MTEHRTSQPAIDSNVPARACCERVHVDTCCSAEAKPNCCGAQTVPATCGCGSGVAEPPHEKQQA